MAQQKVYVSRQIQPITDRRYVTVKLTAVDEVGNVVKSADITKQADVSQAMAVSGAVFDFIHELQAAGFDYEIKTN